MSRLAPVRRLVHPVLLLLVFAASQAFAGPYADALGKRLVASTTPAEKVALVRWMFIAMSLHPDLKSLTSVTPEQRTEANRAVARLFERLLTESCATEAREAVKYEGPEALSSSFQLLGQVAAREIFGNPQVAAGLAELDRFIDRAKLMKALELQPPAPPAPAK